MGTIERATEPRSADGPLRPSTRRRQRTWILPAGLFAAGLAISVLQGVIFSDEAWFLQVVHRVASGQVLYRDISFGVMPLSAYLTLGFTSVFGTQVLVVKALVAACFAVSGVLTWAILRRLGARVSVWVLSLALLAYGFPAPGSLYGPLATAATMGSFALMVAWWDRGRRPGQGSDRRSVVLVGAAGAAAGLAFGAKQNVGVLALGAVVAAVVLAGPARRRGRHALRDVAAALGGFCVVLAVLLVPVVISGGFPKLLEYGFLSKGTYLRRGGQSYWGSLERLWNILTHVDGADQLVRFYLRTVFLLPLLAIAALTVSWLGADRAGRRRVLMVAAFVAALVAGAYPRLDQLHLDFAVPGMLVALVVGWRAAGPTADSAWRRRAALALSGWLALGVGLLIGPPLADLATGRAVVSSIPHFTGPVIAANTARGVPSNASRLRDIERRRGPLFLLMSQAGFYYLVTDIPNPTPFDFPLATTYGEHGKALVERMIEDGRIRSVCRALPPGPLRPESVSRFVKRHLHRVGDVGPCILFSKT